MRSSTHHRHLKLMTAVITASVYLWASGGFKRTDEGFVMRDRKNQMGETNEMTSGDWHIVYRDTYCSHSKAVRNIFIRQGVARNKTFMVPTELMSQPRLAPFTASGHTVRNYQLPRKDGGSIRYNYDLLVNNFYSTWDKLMISSAFPKDRTFYFTLVCDPLTRIATTLHQAKISLQHFADSVDNKLDFMKEVITGQQGMKAEAHQVFASVDLGLHIHYTENEEEITDFLDQISEDFHLVLVQEELEAGLIMMKNLLNWTIDDATIIKPFHPEVNHELRNLTTLARKKLLSWLKPDIQMYQMFGEKFLAQFANQSTEVKQEADKLKDAVKLLSLTCEFSPSVAADFNIPCEEFKADETNLNSKFYHQDEDAKDECVYFAARRRKIQ